MKEPATISYSEYSKEWVLSLRYGEQESVALPLTNDILTSLIKLFSNEGKIQKILGRMEDD